MVITLTMCKKDLNPLGGSVANVDDKRARIEGFLDKARSPIRQKSQTDYSLEEAEWLMEAALNYGTADPRANKDSIHVDEFSVYVPSTNGRVDEADLITAFNDMLDSLAATPLGNDERIIAMDVDARLDNELMWFGVQRAVGNGEPIVLGILNTNFTGTYRCRPDALPSPQIVCQERAGDLAIQQRMNAGIGIYTNDWYLTDIEFWRVWQVWPDIAPEEITDPDWDQNVLPATYFPNANDPTGPGVWYDDYMTMTSPICYGYLIDCEPCLGAGLMTILTQHAWDLMEDVKATYASDPQLDNVACIVQGIGYNLTGNPQNAEWKFCHNVTFVYGNWNLGGSTE